MGAKGTKTVSLFVFKKKWDKKKHTQRHKIFRFCTYTLHTIKFVDTRLEIDISSDCVFSQAALFSVLSTGLCMYLCIYCIYVAMYISYVCVCKVRSI